MTSEESDVAKVADATSEVAKATSKAIDAGSSVTSFLYRVIGEPVEYLAGTYVSDPLREFRKRRLFELQLKTERYLTERDVSITKALPPPLAIPLLESASIETDESLHDLWALLLADAMDSTRPDLDRRLVFVMKALTPSCVSALKLVWEKLQFSLAKLPRTATSSATIKEANNWTEIHVSTFEDVGIDPELVNYLVSLGLLQHPIHKRKASGFTLNADPIIVAIEGEDADLDLIRCSTLGLQFLEAVFADHKH